MVGKESFQSVQLLLENRRLPEIALVIPDHRARHV